MAAFLVFLVVIYATALILSLVTALQSRRLRAVYNDITAKRHMLKQTLAEEGEEGSGGGGNRRRGNIVRAYAISCDLASSKSATEAKTPTFRTHQLTMCEGSSFTDVRPFYFSRPFWLVVDVTRSSRVLYEDVLNGVTRHIVFDSRPCQIRTANKQEVERVQSVADKIRTKRAFLFVIADDRDFSGDCVPPRVFAFGNDTRPDDLPLSISGRARTEKSTGMSTLMHVWGYSVTSTSTVG